MGLSVQTVAATHAPDHGRGDAFGIRHRFVGRHVGLLFFRRDRTVGLPLSGGHSYRLSYLPYTQKTQRVGLSAASLGKPNATEGTTSYM
jgi:hypothetical protein